MPYRVMAVCAGNICRSPIAEAVLTRAFATAGMAEVVVTSAGTGGWHAGDDADPRALAVLRDHGYDLAHAARAFEPEWLADTDLVLALDAANLDSLVRLARRHGLDHGHVRLLREFDPAMAGVSAGDPVLEVPDPYYGGPDGFVTVLGMVEAAAPGVVAFVRGT